MQFFCLLSDVEKKDAEEEPRDHCHAVKAPVKDSPMFLKLFHFFIWSVVWRARCSIAMRPVFQLSDSLIMPPCHPTGLQVTSRSLEESLIAVH